MPDTHTQIEAQPQATTKKACQIQIMFPIDDDSQAMNIKSRIDGVVKDIEHKRYTFNLTEMD